MLTWDPPSCAGSHRETVRRTTESTKDYDVHALQQQSQSVLQLIGQPVWSAHNKTHCCVSQRVPRLARRPRPDGGRLGRSPAGGWPAARNPHAGDDRQLVALVGTASRARRVLLRLAGTSRQRRDYTSETTAISVNLRHASTTLDDSQYCITRPTASSENLHIPASIWSLPR